MTAASSYHDDIIIINLIKIVNCGKDYVMICVCVKKFIIMFRETYIHV